MCAVETNPKSENLFGALVSTSPILCSDLYRQKSVNSSIFSSTDNRELVCPDQSVLSGFESRHAVCSDGHPAQTKCLVCERASVELSVCLSTCDDNLSPVNFERLVYTDFRCKNNETFGYDDGKLSCVEVGDFPESKMFNFS